MANEEQLAILKQGVDVWNKWRNENLDIKIDLRGALLSNANISGSLLMGANISAADLTGADLSGANLGDANISGSLLIGALLIGADLRRVNLNDAKLRDANLDEAYIMRADLSETKLSGSSFSGATLGWNNLGDTNLSEVRGLKEVVHDGPSTIGTNTFARSKGKIPLEFLRGCGLSDWEIEEVKLYKPDLSNEEINKILYKIYDLRASQALQISPLFISYSHADGTFVDKLESHLNQKGIRFWRDVHDAKAGRLEKQIDQAIRQNPTVLLILSSNSIRSDWVEHEVRTARALEQELGRDVLCPVALDDSWKNSPWPTHIMEQVMEYNILDFSAWEDNSKFGKTFSKLIDGLELFYKG